MSVTTTEGLATASTLSRGVDPTVRVGQLCGPRPPRLSGAPLFGQLFEFMRSPFGMFIRGYRECGPVFSISFMDRRMVALAGAESLRFVAKYERELLCSGPVWNEFVGLFGGTRALINADTEVHGELRKRFRPSMSRSTFERRLPQVAQVTRRCLERWDGQSVAVERFCRDLVFHQLAALMDVGPEKADEHYDDLVRVMHTAMEVTVGHRRPRIFLKDPRFRAALQRISKMGLELYREASDLDSDEGLFAALRRCVRDELLTERDVPLLAITPYFAGLDTVAAALSFALAAICRRPELVSELRAEAEAASASEPLGRKWMAHLPLATAVKLESGRRYPALFGFVRQATTPFMYAGSQIEEGDQLFVSTGAQSLMPEYFEEPERFDPGRFLGEAAVQPEQGAFNPYGVGAHTCLGAALADAQLVSSLALLMQQAELELIETQRPLRASYAPYPLLCVVASRRTAPDADLRVGAWRSGSPNTGIRGPVLLAVGSLKCKR